MQNPTQADVIAEFAKIEDKQNKEVILRNTLQAIASAILYCQRDTQSIDPNDIACRAMAEKLTRLYVFIERVLRYLPNRRTNYVSLMRNAMEEMKRTSADLKRIPNAETTVPKKLNSLVGRLNRRFSIAYEKKVQAQLDAETAERIAAAKATSGAKESVGALTTTTQATIAHQSTAAHKSSTSTSTRNSVRSSAAKGSLDDDSPPAAKRSITSGNGVYGSNKTNGNGCLYVRLGGAGDSSTTSTAAAASAMALSLAAKTSTSTLAVRAAAATSASSSTTNTSATTVAVPAAVTLASNAATGMPVAPAASSAVTPLTQEEKRRRQAAAAMARLEMAKRAATAAPASATATASAQDTPAKGTTSVTLGSR